MYLHAHAGTFAHTHTRPHTHTQLLFLCVGKQRLPHHADSELANRDAEKHLREGRHGEWVPGTSLPESQVKSASSLQKSSWGVSELLDEGIGLVSAGTCVQQLHLLSYHSCRAGERLLLVYQHCNKLTRMITYHLSPENN